MYIHVYLLKKTSTAKAQETLKKRDWKACKSQKVRDLALRLCLQGLLGAVSIISHQHDSMNMICTKATAIDSMPKRREKSHEAPMLHKELLS